MIPHHYKMGDHTMMNLITSYLVRSHLHNPLILDLRWMKPTSFLQSPRLMHAPIFGWPKHGNNKISNISSISHRGNVYFIKQIKKQTSTSRIDLVNLGLSRTSIILCIKQQLDGNVGLWLWMCISIKLKFVSPKFVAPNLVKMIKNSHRRWWMDILVFVCMKESNT